jgi:sugar phosphate isomerase/epimerase
MIPCRYLVQHLGVSGEEFDLHKLDAAFAALEELKIFAGQRQVEILLENTPNAFSSAERLLLFEEVTHLGLNFVFDTGHANLGEGVEAAFGLMKSRIRSTHVHDNDGKTDQHLFPTMNQGGTIDWKKTMELLRSGGEQYPLVLELKERPEIGNPLEAAKQIFERLEQL